MNDDALVEYYAERGDAFEAVYDAPALQDRLDAVAADLRSAVADRTVLEVACGSGYWTRILAASATTVLATDAAREVLRTARTSLDGVDDVAVVQADAYDLPVTGPFEAAVGAGWLSHVPRERCVAFLEGLHDCLEAGARVCFLDTARPQHDAVRTDDAGNRYERRTVDGERFEVLKNFPDADELRAMVGDAAVEVDYDDYGQFWSFAYRLARE